MLLDIHAEAVNDFLGVFQRGRAQQHDKFFAAEAKYPVLRAERRGHQVGDQDQYFIAIQVAELTVR